ncbi:MAG: ABC transporter ATP-binding protein [Anaerolineae bacterium]|nr:ABC transporter ATP-binding protein [Anaerolineae bacterium]
MIEVNNLVKRYGLFTAVNGISFTAEPGQVTGFLGPNGAGKTTTMRVLTGFSPPTAGHATVAGYDVFENSMDVRKNVGYLPENVPLYRDMSAIGYLTYVGEIRGVKQRKSRAMDALRRVGLGKRAKNTIRTLSKGMRQRVGLAAALMHDPQVLILDEPTIGLDPIQVLELRDLVKDLGREHTVLFSTHILSEAEQICDRVVIINQGEVIAHGEPVALREELERGQRIFVRTEEAPTTILSTVQAVEGVAEAQIERDAVIAIPNDIQQDPRAAIARALVENNFNVLELRPAANNLEEIFLELTRGSTEEDDIDDELAGNIESSGVDDDNEENEVVAESSVSETPDKAESEV